MLLSLKRLQVAIQEDFSRYLENLLEKRASEFINEALDSITVFGFEVMYKWKLIEKHYQKWDVLKIFSSVIGRCWWCDRQAPQRVTTAYNIVNGLPTIYK